MANRSLIPRILIVDDTWFMRDKLRIFFLNNGFDVVAEADNGLKGVEEFNRHKPDLVTMDINMPYMGGIEAVREIKNLDLDANIIMVSAMGNPATIKEARLAGAKDFVVKPYNENDLAKKVKSILVDDFNEFYGL